MTKHGWLDGDKKVFVFRDILDEVGKFLRVSTLRRVCTERKKWCNIGSCIAIDLPPLLLVMEIFPL